MRAGLGGLGATVHGNCCRNEARRGVQGLKTKGSSILVDTGMAKGNHKKTYTPDDISSKNSVLEDHLIGSFDNKYDDRVQKLIDIGKEKGYLLYDEVSDLLPPEIGASAEDLDELLSAFGTAGIEVIAAADQNFAGLDKISWRKEIRYRSHRRRHRAGSHSRRTRKGKRSRSHVPARNGNCSLADS